MESLAHDHCGNCFRMHCDNLSCGVTACGNGCGFQMHYCKISGHSHICQKARVPCPNVEYGCPAIMPRENVKNHLKSCPASIVFCTMEWRRCPIYSKHRLNWVPFIQPNPVLVKGHLDVELALRDQTVLEEIARQRMRKGKAKVDIERQRLNNHVSAGAGQREKSRADINEISEGNEEVLSHSQRVNSIIGDNTPRETERRKVSPCDSENATTTNAREREEVLLKLELISKTADSSALCEESAVIPPPPKCVPMYLDRPLGLNVMIESLPKFVKQTPMYSIPCNQIFRRDEYNHHFRNIHNDIQGGLNGWLQHRCPLAQYGCTFVSYRFRPHRQCDRLFFSQELGSFGVKPGCAEVAAGLLTGPPNNEESHLGICSSEGDACDLLTTCLPVEILINIIRRLDGFSLRNFSCTCKRLREICQEVVKKRGMVLMEWEKRVYENGKRGWRIRQKKWCFSTAFDPVDVWVHTEDSFMAAHVEKCPYFDHHIPPKMINFSKLGSKCASTNTKMKWRNGTDNSLSESSCTDSSTITK